MVLKKGNFLNDFCRTFSIRNKNTEPLFDIGMTLYRAYYSIQLPFYRHCKRNDGSKFL